MMVSRFDPDTAPGTWRHLFTNTLNLPFVMSRRGTIVTGHSIVAVLIWRVVISALVSVRFLLVSLSKNSVDSKRQSGTSVWLLSDRQVVWRIGADLLGGHDGEFVGNVDVGRECCCCCCCFPLFKTSHCESFCVTHVDANRLYKVWKWLLCLEAIRHSSRHKTLQRTNKRLSPKLLSILTTVRVLKHQEPSLQLLESCRHDNGPWRWREL